MDFGKAGVLHEFPLGTRTAASPANGRHSADAAMTEKAKSIEPKLRHG